MNRRAVLFLRVTALVLAATALASCTGGSQETKNPTNFTPSMVFMKEDSAGFQQTWVANKDLSNQVKLTNESADSGWAVWNPGATSWPSNPIAPIPTPTTRMPSTTSSR